MASAACLVLVRQSLSFTPVLPCGPCLSHRSLIITVISSSPLNPLRPHTDISTEFILLYPDPLIQSHEPDSAVAARTKHYCDSNLAP